MITHKQINTSCPSDSCGSRFCLAHNASLPFRFHAYNVLRTSCPLRLRSRRSSSQRCPHGACRAHQIVSTNQVSIADNWLVAYLWAANCHQLLTAQGRTSGAGCAARLSQSSGRSLVGAKRESDGATSTVASQVPSNQPSLPKRRKRARHRRCQGLCTRSANRLNLGTVRSGRAGRRCWRAVHRPGPLAARRLYH